jgi:hypothetical protein
MTEDNKTETELHKTETELHKTETELHMSLDDVEEKDTTAEVPMPTKSEKKINEKLNEALAKITTNPDAIIEIISVKREAELEIARTARRFHDALLEVVVNHDLEYRRQNVNQFKDNHEAIKILESDERKIIEIQRHIRTFENNVTKGENYKRDKKTDEAQYNELLMTSSTPNPINAISIKTTSHEGKDFYYEVNVHSLEQLEARSKQIDQMLKTWKGLSQMKNDTDRSFGYRKLSDNLASIAMTGINTGRQGMAFAQALLTYAVVDVLYQGVINGTLKNMADGYRGGRDLVSSKIKNAANAMYMMMNNSEKNLEKAVNTLSKRYIDDQNVENIREQAEKITLRLTNLQDNQTTAFTEQHALDLQWIKQAVHNASQYHLLPKPNLVTKGVAGISGLLAGVVTAIGNIVVAPVKAVGSTVLHPTTIPQAVTNQTDKLKKRYQDIKPEQGESWNKTRSQVKEERINKKKAKTQVKYANFTEKENNRKKASTESTKEGRAY